MDTSLLGIYSIIIDIDPAHLDAIDTQDLFIPDKFYVINFEHPHNYGPITMTIGSAASKYYQAWNDYCIAIRYNMDEFSRLSGYVTSQIDWRQVIAPMLSESVEYDGRVACSVIRCYGTDLGDTVCLYLLINDPAALVELGANSGDVRKLRSMIPDQEQKYIQRMYDRYKDAYLTEENASDLDKMWMAYFGFQFYNPPPPPSSPSLPDSRPSRSIIYKEPLVNMGRYVGVKGHFVHIKYISDFIPGTSYADTSFPYIYIDAAYSGVKPVSEVCFWSTEEWRSNGVYLLNRRHLQLVQELIAKYKGIWVYCDKAFVDLFRYLNTPSTITQYRVFSGFYGSDVQALRARTYLDRNKLMVVRSQEKFSFVDVTSFALISGMPSILFAYRRLLYLSAT